LDLLLIDDIQYIDGKSGTQREFLELLELLIAANKQVVIAADAYPKNIVGIEPELISRFCRGLVVAIEPLGLELQVSILRQKCSELGCSIGDDILNFIVEHFGGDVRQIEGALTSINFHTKLMSCPVTINSVKKLFPNSQGLESKVATA
jgi:chromosomal replication initiator protein